MWRKLLCWFGWHKYKRIKQVDRIIGGDYWGVDCVDECSCGAMRAFTQRYDHRRATDPLYLLREIEYRENRR